MKRMICIVLIGWLPIFMVTASATRLQMMWQDTTHEMQQAEATPCHDKTSQQQHKEVHQCVVCGFCMMATAMANIDTVPAFVLPVLTSAAPMSADVLFTSTNYSPALRPPILN